MAEFRLPEVGDKLLLKRGLTLKKVIIAQISDGNFGLIALNTGKGVHIGDTAMWDNPFEMLGDVQKQYNISFAND